MGLDRTIGGCIMLGIMANSRKRIAAVSPVVLEFSHGGAGFSFATVSYAARLPLAGELLVSFHKMNESSSAGIPNVGAGWTNIFSEAHFGINAKVSDGTETATNFSSTVNATDKGNAAIVMIFSGDHDITNIQSAFINSSNTAPSLTPDTNGSMLVCSGMRRTTIQDCVAVDAGVDASLTLARCQIRGSSNFCGVWTYYDDDIPLSATGTKAMSTQAEEVASIIIGTQ